MFYLFLFSDLRIYISYKMVLRTFIRNRFHLRPTTYTRVSRKIKSIPFARQKKYLFIHWGRVTHICVGELTIIVSDNSLSPGRRQAIIRTNNGILLIGPYGTNFSEILIEILTFSFTKMSLKVSSAKWRPFCLGLKLLRVFNESRLPSSLWVIIPVTGRCHVKTSLPFGWISARKT